MNSEVGQGVARRVGRVALAPNGLADFAPVPTRLVSTSPTAGVARWRSLLNVGLLLWSITDAISLVLRREGSEGVGVSARRGRGCARGTPTPSPVRISRDEPNDG